MATGKSVEIPFPTSSFPGAVTQESAGRIINIYAEPLGDKSPSPVAWHRSPGLTLYASTALHGYRGGLLVVNLAYEVFAEDAATPNVVTVDAAGTVSALIGVLAGLKGVQIARNNASPPNVIAVDIDNGAYQLDTGTVTAYTSGGVLPQPKSICYQDGYLFFGIADRRVFATGINTIVINALTFISVQAKSSDILQRLIPFGGLLFIFCSSSTEVWQDTAQPAPGFPYSRLVVLEYGLLQENAIAGYEDGFSILMWVAQDYGVWQLQPGSFQPTKISPPDLDRLIQSAFLAGLAFDARAYITSGRKFWVLSCSRWSWEFNTATNKWNERASRDGLTSVLGRVRSIFGHPGFGKWLTGDIQSGNLLFTDETNYTENGIAILARMESAPVEDFPNRMRIARADFSFVTGVGRATNSLVMMVKGAVAGTGGVVRLTVNNTAGMIEGDTLLVADVNGTTEANGAFTSHIVDATHVELLNSIFLNAYISGGTATDITAPVNMQNPVVSISCSRDDGITFGNPWIRNLGQQARSKTRIKVLNAGLSGPAGVIWRWDMSDPVYLGFFGAKQSSELREN